MPGSDSGDRGHLCCCEAVGTEVVSAVSVHGHRVLQVSPLANFSLYSDI